MKAKSGTSKAIVTIPNEELTFEDLQSANPQWKPLRLRNFIRRDSLLGDDSLLVVLPKTKCNDKNFMGRPSKLYRQRHGAFIGRDTGFFYHY